MRNVIKYPLFVISGLAGTIVLTIISELSGLTRTSFFPFSGPSYATWVYPFYLFIGFFIFYKVLKLPRKIFVYFIVIFIIFFVWYFATSEGQMFTNPIPFGVGAF